MSLANTLFVRRTLFVQIGSGVVGECADSARPHRRAPCVDFCLMGLRLKITLGVFLGVATFLVIEATAWIEQLRRK